MTAIRMKQPVEGKRFDRPELDLLRLLAFCLVFVRHAPPFRVSVQPLLHAVSLFCQGGAFGVDVFFVLSAYLITELLRREKLRTGTLDLGAFYMRRILRIWPLYYVFLFSVGFFTRHSADRLPPGALLAFSLLAGNWYCTGGFVEGPAGPLWSVSIEEQFYLAWPLLLRVLRRRQILWLSCSLLIVSALVKTSLLLHGAAYARIWCNTFARMDTIAVGVLTAYLLEGKLPLLSGLLRTLLALVACALIYLAIAYCHVLGTPTVVGGLLGYLCGLLAALAYFFAFLGAFEGGFPAVFEPLRYLGRISFGLYVFHELAIGLWAPPHFAALHTFPALVTTIVFAWISYELLEKPFLRLKGRFTKVRSVPLVA